MTTQHRAREVGHWGLYVLYATALHAGMVALGLISSCRAALTVEPPAPTSIVSVEMEAAGAPTTPPGGGSPVRGEAPEAKDPPMTRAVKAKTAPPKAPTPVATTLATAEPPPATDIAAVQAAMEHRHEEAAMAAAAAALGAGRGANGGPGGPGEGWGAPSIRGTTAFGNGSRGAFTGRVCFLPVGTLRIADVHDCQYSATVYTDTFNIPERQYHDGFPGVTDRSDWFLIDYVGTFAVSEYGSYEFRLHSDDGSYLYIDDKLVIENDGKHAPASRSGSIALSAGEHRMKVRYAQTTDRMALQLFVRVPGQSAEQIFTPRL
jgi:hypothetical protein